MNEGIDWVTPAGKLVQHPCGVGGIRAWRIRERVIAGWSGLI